MRGIIGMALAAAFMVSSADAAIVESSGRAQLLPPIADSANMFPITAPELAALNSASVALTGFFPQQPLALPPSRHVKPVPAPNQAALLSIAMTGLVLGWFARPVRSAATARRPIFEVLRRNRRSCRS